MIELKNIVQIFSQAKIFDGFNLRIDAGEFVVVMGDNGAGKSTLCNLISGKLIPDEGQVFLAGRDVTALSEHKRALQIAHVLQDPKAGTNGSMTVRENLSLALHKGRAFSLRRAVTRGNDAEFERVLAELDMGLESCLDQMVSSLSGGQRQALSLVMATLNQPRILLLDEHTAALDPHVSQIILRKTQEIVRKNSLTTVMITHHIPSAAKYGERLIFLRQGKICADISGGEKAKLTIGDIAELFA